MKALRFLLLCLSGIGTTAFGVALALSLLNPAFVERVAKDIIRHQIETKVREKFDALDAGFLASRAGAILQAQEQELHRIRQMLASQLPERIERAMHEMADLNCECRKKLEGAVRSGMQTRVASLQQMQERVTALIRTHYMDTAQQLTREFRIFTGSNALAFLLLGVAVLVRRTAGLHLVPAAVVVIGASAVNSALYLFQQN